MRKSRQKQAADVPALVRHRNPDMNEERGRESDANLFSSILREELKESRKQNEMEGEGKR